MKGKLSKRTPRPVAAGTAGRGATVRAAPVAPATTTPIPRPQEEVPVTSWARREAEWIRDNGW